MYSPHPIAGRGTGGTSGALENSALSRSLSHLRMRHTHPPQPHLIPPCPLLPAHPAAGVSTQLAGGDRCQSSTTTSNSPFSGANS